MLRPPAQTHPLDFHADQLSLNIAHDFQGRICKMKRDHTAIFADDRRWNLKGLALVINGKIVYVADWACDVPFDKHIDECPRLAETNQLRQYRGPAIATDDNDFFIRNKRNYPL